jgi:NADH-quinone oxidoreductase subunit E
MSEMLLTTDALKRIDAEVAKYPPERKQSAVMMALNHRAGREGLARHRDDGPVAASTSACRRSRVYEVATFYTMYKPQADRQVQAHAVHLPAVRACRARSPRRPPAREARASDFNETTADGRFTLKEGECMGACAMAPVLLVTTKKMHDYMSNEKARPAHPGPKVR